MSASLVLHDKRSLSHWIKSAILVIVVYLVTSAIIWFAFYREKPKTVVAEPIAAHIVVEISPTTTTDAQLTNLVDDQKE